MQVRIMAVGPYRTNCYLLSDRQRGRCGIIDPGNDAPFLIQAIQDTHLPLEAILLTHAHWDHVAGLKEVHDAYPTVPIYVGLEDQEFLGPDALKRFEETGADPGFLKYFQDALKDLPEPTHLLHGGELLFDGQIEAIATGGHTKGGISYYVPRERLLFCGDTLFAGSVGRTDLYGGSFSQLAASIQKLRQLPPETRIFPGHGPESTLAREEAENPYFR